MWVLTSRIRSVSLLFSAFAFAFGLGACSNGGGGSSAGGLGAGSGAGGTGTVAVVMTDAPGSEFDEINVTVIRIELLCEAGRATLFEGEQTFDLLRLSEFSEFFAVAEGVLPGPCDKVRMTLTDLELVRKNDQGEVIETFHPKLPGNGKLDLNPRMPFFVVAGATLMLEIDMDAKNSIHVVGTGNDRYQFRPEVFVRVLDTGVLGKIIRLEGTIDEREDDEFELCLPQPANHNHDDDVCVEVHLRSDTAIFNAQADAVGSDALNATDHVIVYARFRPDDHSHHDDSNDDNGYHDDSDDDEENDFDMIALVVELGPPGTFVALTGMASDAATNSIFPFMIDPAQASLDAGTTVQAELQTATRIFSKEADVLDASAIADGVAGTASGLLSSGTALKSTIVILDTSTP